MRYWNLLLALCSLGDVDIWLLDEPDPSRARALSVALGGQRVVAEVPTRKGRRWRRARDLRWMLGSQVPRSHDDVSFDASRTRFREWAAPRYDVAVFLDPICFTAFGAIVDAPKIVDLDDVPDQTAARQLHLQERRLAGRPLSPRTVLRKVRGRLEVKRWKEFQDDLAAEGVFGLACSGADRSRLGWDRVVVVPNGYERVGAPLGRACVTSPATILFQGWLRYPPNADAVELLALEILPRIREHHADTELVLAGAVSQRTSDLLTEEDGVHVLGLVPSMDDVLAKADLIAVPLRAGGGSRIKILEAFAHRIPVVSTTIGAEGLDVVPGRELLIADSPDEFADACVRLLEDRLLRGGIIEAAQRRVERDYWWPQIREEFASVARRAAASAAPTDG
jgi:hypothetical protein